MPFFTKTPTQTIYLKQLFVPQPYMENGVPQGEPKYSCTFVFSPDHPDLKDLRVHCAQVARAKWQDLPTDAASLKAAVQFPWRSGDEANAEKVSRGKKPYEVIKGKTTLKASSTRPPMLAILENGGITQLESDLQRATGKSKFYEGVECFAEINFVAMQKGRNRFVVAYLNQVMSTNTGTRLGSTGTPASEIWKGHVGSLSAVNPMADEEAF